MKNNYDKIYAVFKEAKIVRMSKDRVELEKYIESFPPDERNKLALKEKEPRGNILSWRKADEQ